MMYLCLKSVSMALPLYFAPLQGFTEDVYRRTHLEVCGGVDEYYTPFLRVEHGEVRKKDSLDIRPEYNIDVPLVLQLIARDKSEMEYLSGAILRQRDEWMSGDSSGKFTCWANKERIRIDVNMGCPFPMQVKHGRGAGILMHPEKVREVCDFVREHTAWDFSVKMRLGVESSEDWREILPILNDTPLKHITLHPRIAKQQYGGVPNREAFEAFMQECHHPVVFNGDVTTVEQIVELERNYPNLAGVMIGRGLLARPTLAREYKLGVMIDENEVKRTLLQLHDTLHRHYADIIPGEAQLLSKLRSFWEYTEPTIGHKAWKKIHKAGNMRNYLSAVSEVG